MTFEIAYKHQEHGSDTIGVIYRTLQAAIEDVRLIQSDPGRVGMCEWLKDAALWVVDEDGNIHYS